MRKKGLSLSSKVILWTGLCTVLTAGAILGYSTFALRSKAMEAAVRQVKELAREESGQLRQDIVSAFSTAQTLAQVLSQVRNPDSPLDIPRYEAMQLLRSVLEENPQFQKVFSCWQLNSYDYMDVGYVGEAGHDDSGRFAPAWSRTEDGELRLRPLLSCPVHSPGGEPGPWYQLVRQSGRPLVMEPYQPPKQQDLHASVISPVRSQEEVHGVIGIEISLQPMQQRLQRLAPFAGQARCWWSVTRGRWWPIRLGPSTWGSRRPWPWPGMTICSLL